LPLAARFLTQDGICLCLKGAKAEAELTEAGRDWTMSIDRIPSQTSPDGVVLQLSNLRKRESGS
jgi:16S rRNA (guanine527-N7)-methyltransferase